MGDCKISFTPTSPTYCWDLAIIWRSAVKNPPPHFTDQMCCCWFQGWVNLASMYRHTKEVATNHNPRSHELPDRLLQTTGGVGETSRSSICPDTSHPPLPAQQMNITLLFIDDPTCANDTLATGEGGHSHTCCIHSYIRALIISISRMSCISINLDVTSESLQMMFVFISVRLSPFTGVCMLEYNCIHICLRWEEWGGRREKCCIYNGALYACVTRFSLKRPAFARFTHGHFPLFFCSPHQSFVSYEHWCQYVRRIIDPSQGLKVSGGHWSE